ncbi:MAG: macrocin O-methyltransferase [bacterium]|nr:macrocin O-methyltransferase [bacterium]
MNEERSSQLYLDLMKNCLLGLIYRDPPVATFAASGEGEPYLNASPSGFDKTLRKNGRDWPSQSHSMIGLKRMDHLQYCIGQALKDKVPGDLIETGVWRGGAAIFMRAVLKACGVTDRTVWVADSFQGFPSPNPAKYPVDGNIDFGALGSLMFQPDGIFNVSKDTVMSNFEAYGLLDDQVRFLEGWFKDTLPAAPIDDLAVLRLDGDLYESTMDALSSLYGKLSPGGFCIIDDYEIRCCAAAVHDFRAKEGIADEIIKIDDAAVYWRRSA